MDELEVFALIGSVTLASCAIFKTATIQYHPLFFSWNPGFGFARLSVWAGFLFAGAAVVKFSASDIVTDMTYVGLYLVMGYALIKAAGQLDPIYKVSYRVDVLERRNSAAGFYLGARTLAIALIFSGSMIGEGPGFYVVLGFFGLGWLTLEAMIYFLCVSRGWNLKKSILRESDMSRTAVIAASYVAIALVLRWACAGDFAGWAMGTRDFFVKASPILILFVFPVLRLHGTYEVWLTLIYGSLFLLKVPQ